jgi:hypothetical protein
MNAAESQASTRSPKLGREKARRVVVAGDISRSAAEQAIDE